MAETMEFESDQFLKLLTDALRAGPGSPQWHEAVARLREANPAEADEYKLLIDARENLEGGREYRSVRAGPGFTRKVMEAIDEEAAGKKAPLPSASIIAVLSVVVVVGVIVAVAAFMLKGTPAAPGTIQDLRNQSFAKTVISTDFTSEIPPEWKTFGVEPVLDTMDRALRAGVDPKSDRDFRGGGIVSATPFPADQPLQIDVTANVGGTPDQLVLQLFVTDDPSFGGKPEATTPGEFVVYLRRNVVEVVMPDGSIVGEQGRVEAKKSAHLLLRMDEKFVIVEDGAGRELYAGPHGLPPDKPRWPGVRFLTTGRSMDDVSVQSIRVLKP